MTNDLPLGTVIGLTGQTHDAILARLGELGPSLPQYELLQECAPSPELVPEPASELERREYRYMAASLWGAYVELTLGNGYSLDDVLEVYGNDLSVRLEGTYPDGADNPGDQHLSLLDVYGWLAQHGERSMSVEDARKAYVVGWVGRLQSIFDAIVRAEFG